MDEGKLTAKEERFCLEYIVDYKPAEAAVRAGYKGSSARTQGWRMLKKEAILLRVRELQEEYNKLHCFSEKSRFIGETWKTYEKAKEDNDGRIAVKCLELIGKTNGLFTDNVEHKFGSGGIEVNVRVADDDE